MSSLVDQTAGKDDPTGVTPARNVRLGQNGAVLGVQDVGRKTAGTTPGESPYLRKSVLDHDVAGQRHVLGGTQEPVAGRRGRGTA